MAAAAPSSASTSAPAGPAPSSTEAGLSTDDKGTAKPVPSACPIPPSQKRSDEIDAELLAIQQKSEQLKAEQAKVKTLIVGETSALKRLEDVKAELLAVQQKSSQLKAEEAKLQELIEREKAALFGKDVKKLMDSGFADRPLKELGMTLYELAKLPLEARSKLLDKQDVTFSDKWWDQRNLREFLATGADSLGWE
jgi:hypothetical protein